MKTKIERMYTLEETAEILGVGVRTIYRRIKKGDIEAHKEGNHYRISRSAIRRYREKAIAETSNTRVA